MNNFFKKHLATILSIVATIIVGYIGIVWSQNQFKKAEFERRDRVKEEIVRIIEEHIINKKPITPSRLNRLTEIKCKNEELSIPFTPYELLENAEYNLLESRHLDFTKKEEYKVLFDSVYQIFIPDAFLRLKSDTTTLYAKNYELIDALVQNINECKPTVSIEQLETLISIYEIEINSLKKESKGELERKLDALLKSPIGMAFMITFVLIYILVMFPMTKKILSKLFDARTLRKEESKLNDKL